MNIQNEDIHPAIALTIILFVFMVSVVALGYGLDKFNQWRDNK